MQAEFELQRPLPLAVLKQQPILPLFYFTAPLFDFAFHATPLFFAGMETWVSVTLAGIGMEGQQVRSGVRANSFAATGEMMKLLDERGLWDVVVDSKVKSQGCERLLGGVFANLGYEPFVYSLASTVVWVHYAEAGANWSDESYWVGKKRPREELRYSAKK